MYVKSELVEQSGREKNHWLRCNYNDMLEKRAALGETHTKYKTIALGFFY